jgi:hypothetical protein
MLSFWPQLPFFHRQQIMFCRFLHSLVDKAPFLRFKHHLPSELAKLRLPLRLQLYRFRTLTLGMRTPLSRSLLPRLPRTRNPRRRPLRQGSRNPRTVRNQTQKRLITLLQLQPNLRGPFVLVLLLGKLLSVILLVSFGFIDYIHIGHIRWLYLQLRLMQHMYISNLHRHRRPVSLSCLAVVLHTLMTSSLRA